MNTPPVQYVRTADGYNIAYCTSGAGKPWVFIPNGIHHLRFTARGGPELIWASRLAERFTVIQYDARGQGLSTRDLPQTFSMEDWTRDLEAIFDELHLENVILFGTGSACHTAVRFAAKHPSRVSALVLAGLSLTPEQHWSSAVFESLAKADWEAFIETQTALLRTARGTSSGEHLTKERMLQAVTQSDFATMFAAFQHSRVDDDVTQIETPVLILYPSDETRRQSFEEAAAITALFPHGRIMEVSGFMPWPDFASSISVIETFLAERPPVQAPTKPSSNAANLSLREIEVLRLLAGGRSNRQIADELVISLNTVNRHVSNIYAKSGAANRAQAAVYATEHNLLDDPDYFA